MKFELHKITPVKVIRHFWRDIFVLIPFYSRAVICSTILLTIVQIPAKFAYTVRAEHHYSPECIIPRRLPADIFPLMLRSLYCAL